MSDVTYDDEDNFFTEYDFDTHGDASVYTLDGFGFEDDGSDTPPEIGAYSLTFYGSSDLAWSHTLADDWETSDDEDDQDLMDWEIDAGFTFAVSMNGSTIDPNYDVSLALLDIYYDFGTTEDDTDDLNVRLMEIEIDDGAGTVDTGIFYISGDLLGIDGVPSLSEFTAIGDALDDESDPSSVTPVADGVLTFADITLADITTIDSDVPVMPDSDGENLCALFGEDFDYGAFVEDAVLTYVLPTYLTDWSGPLMTLDGYVEDDQMLDQDYKDAVKAFADHLEDLEDASAGYGLRIYDFEDMNSGNFAGSASSYTPDGDDAVNHQTGDLSSGTASGALIPDDFLSIYLFNTGDTVGSPAAGDDPGIATHQGNDADRGFNMSAENHLPYGEQYLEVLPGNTTHGGVVLCFDEPAYGFGFNLMGREDDKRDVFLDIHLSNGDIIREDTGQHPNNSGGAQYISYMMNDDNTEDLSICAVVLYEPQQSDPEEINARDIFSIDDLTVVVNEADGTHTSDDLKDNTRDAGTDDDPCYDMDDTMFTEYDFSTHGDASVYTLDGFGFEDDGSDTPPEIGAYSLTFYGSSDLAWSHTLADDWETSDDEDDQDLMDWEIDAGFAFAVSMNGSTIDPNYDVSLALLDIYYDFGTTEDDTDDLNVRLMEIEIDDGAGTVDTGIFYISGDLLGVDGVPSLSEFTAIGDALDDESDPSSVTPVADGVLTFADITLADITTIDSDVPVMPEVEVSMSLCCLMSSDDIDYDATFGTLAAGEPLPIYLTAYISDSMELDGPVDEDVELSEDVVDTVTDFATAVNAMGGGYGLRLYDFENHAIGNFAESTSGYVASGTDVIDDVSGDMATGTARGTLWPDEFVAFHLFETGHSAGSPPNIGDDPGIATHEGNDADRGFNITASSGGAADGDQYLEVLPSETGPGGLIVCFDQPTYGFGFHLMGREDTKRDVFLDLHMSDGTIHRELTDTNVVNTGGLQYYSFVLDPVESAGVTIKGFVLYETLEGDEDASSRDIFAIDDLAIVTNSDDAAMSATDLIDVTRLSDDSKDLTPLYGTAGDDLIEGGADDEAIYGYEGSDTLKGAAGNDYIEAGLGADIVTGGDGDDQIFGGGGWDQLRGNDGADMINGMNGNDYVYGGVDGDMLIGSGGRDRLRGNNGDDTMEGGQKNDFLQGGAGADVFVFNTNDGSWGKDFIKDFELGVDQVVVEGFTSDDVVWKEKADASGVIAKFAGGGKIAFNNLIEEDLNDFSDWLFI